MRHFMHDVSCPLSFPIFGFKSGCRFRDGECEALLPEAFPSSVLPCMLLSLVHLEFVCSDGIETSFLCTLRVVTSSQPIFESRDHPAVSSRVFGLRDSKPCR